MSAPSGYKMDRTVIDTTIRFVQRRRQIYHGAVGCRQMQAIHPASVLSLFEPGSRQRLHTDTMREKPALEEASNYGHC